MIEVTGINLEKFAKKVYELSPPDFSMQKYDSSSLIGKQLENPSFYIKDGELDMGLAEGRECHMKVYKKADKLFIDTPWLHHDNGTFSILLEEFGINTSEISFGKHDENCQCFKCNLKIDNEVVERMCSEISIAEMVYKQISLEVRIHKLEGIIDMLLQTIQQSINPGNPYN